MTATPVLSSGAVPQSRYSGLPGVTGNAVLPLSRTTTLLLSQPGDGKTYLLEDCPGAYIINCDLSSTVNPRCRAVKWPVKDPASGLVTGADGQPRPFTFDDVESVLTQLRQLSESKSPRPELVVIDSVSTLYTLLTRWLVANAHRVRVSSAPVKEWNELHGPSAYDWVYSKIVSIIQDLSRWGYGVVLTAHVVNIKVPLENDAHNFVPDIAMGDGLWKRLYPLFELTAALVRTHKTETSFQEVTNTVRGQEVKSKQKITQDVERFSIEFRSPKLSGLTKIRVPVPYTIELPENNPWDAFASAYETARQRVISGQLGRGTPTPTSAPVPAETESPTPTTP